MSFHSCRTLHTPSPSTSPDTCTASNNTTITDNTVSNNVSTPTHIPSLPHRPPPPPATIDSAGSFASVSTSTKPNNYTNASTQTPIPPPRPARRVENDHLGRMMDDIFAEDVPFLRKVEFYMLLTEYSTSLQDTANSEPEQEMGRKIMAWLRRMLYGNRLGLGVSDEEAMRIFAGDYPRGDGGNEEDVAEVGEDDVEMNDGGDELDEDLCVVKGEEESAGPIANNSGVNSDEHKNHGTGAHTHEQTPVTQM